MRRKAAPDLGNVGVCCGDNGCQRRLPEDVLLFNSTSDLIQQILIEFEFKYLLN